MTKNKNKLVKYEFIEELVELFTAYEKENNISTTGIPLDDLISMLTFYQSRQSENIKYSFLIDFPGYDGGYELRLNKVIVESDEDFDLRLNIEKQKEDRRLKEKEERKLQARRKLYEELKQEFEENGI